MLPRRHFAEERAKGELIRAEIPGGAARLLASLLYEVKPLDPITYAAVAAVLGATMLLAGAIPARRAATVDPASMLK